MATKTQQNKKATPPPPPLPERKKFDSTIIVRMNASEVQLLEKVKQQTGIGVASKAIIECMQIVTGHYMEVMQRNQELIEKLEKLEDWRDNLHEVITERNRYNTQLESILATIPKPEPVRNSGYNYFDDDDNDN